MRTPSNRTGPGSRLGISGAASRWRALLSKVLQLCVLVAGIGVSIAGSSIIDFHALNVAATKDALRATGTAEEVALRLEPLVIEMAGVVTELVPGRRWIRDSHTMKLPCNAVPGEYDSATTLLLPSVMFIGPVPDDVWAQALSRVRAIASRVGADELVVRTDKPGDHDIELIGAYKLHFGLISRGGSLLSASTGCHLND